MRGEWETIEVGNVAVVRSGYAFKSSDWKDSGIPVVKIANVKGGRLDMSGCSFVTSETAEQSGEFQLCEGDILVAMTGYIGDVARVRKTDLPCVLNQRVGKFTVRDRSRLNPNYLFSFLAWSETRKTIEALGYGSAQPNVSPSLIHKIEIPLPPLAEQEVIASVLGALDSKIELNRRMNATLEAMARALFQSWFVDFDPVRAKLDGRQPAGLDEATAALFPVTFQDSAIGHIPNGWKVGVLGELTKFVIGGDWGKTEPADDATVSCYCIRGADIPSLQEGGIGKMPSRYLKPSSVEKRQLMDGDLAIEISGGSPTQCTGRPVLVLDGLLRSLGSPLVASNFCRIVKLKSPVFSKFVYCWLRSLYDGGALFQFETGTTGIKNFAFVLFSEKYPLVVPDAKVVEAFDRVVSPLFAKIQANAHQSRTLATLRDTLLPRLLSGELRVNQAPEEAIA